MTIDLCINNSLMHKSSHNELDMLY